MDTNPQALSHTPLTPIPGVDRCGKTTQTQKLVESLAAKGHSVELWRFPDRTTEIGKVRTLPLSVLTLSASRVTLYPLWNPRI